MKFLTSGRLEPWLVIVAESHRNWCGGGGAGPGQQPPRDDGLVITSDQVRGEVALVELEKKVHPKVCNHKGLLLAESGLYSFPTYIVNLLFKSRLY